MSFYCPDEKHFGLIKLLINYDCELTAIGFMSSSEWCLSGYIQHMLPESKTAGTIQGWKQYFHLFWMFSDKKTFCHVTPEITTWREFSCVTVSEQKRRPAKTADLANLWCNLHRKGKETEENTKIWMRDGDEWTSKWSKLQFLSVTGCCTFSVSLPFSVSFFC